MCRQIYTCRDHCLCYASNGDDMERDIQIEKTKEEHQMPTVERVNCDMIEYLKKMEQYIAEFDSLPREEAVSNARKNLLATGIIDENGNLTGYYKV